MANLELKSCPFCGGGPVEYTHREGELVGCDGCEVSVIRPDRAMARNDWNKRFDLAPAGELVSREAMLKECERWLEKLKAPHSEREHGARVAVVRLVKNLAALPPVARELVEKAEYREGDLEKFFGIDPDFTGDLSTEEHLQQIRERESVARVPVAAREDHDMDCAKWLTDCTCGSVTPTVEEKDSD